MDCLTTRERTVLETLIRVNRDYEKTISEETSKILLEQVSAAEVKERKLTGVGFFTDFTVPDTVARIKDKNPFRIGEVAAELNDVPNGAAFLLLIKEGVIFQLEGYTYAENEWSPIDGESFKLKRITYSSRDENGKYAGKLEDL